MEVEKVIQKSDNLSEEEEEEEVMSEERQQMMKKIDDILSQYYLNGVQKFAAQNFIQFKMIDPANFQLLARAREWVIMKLNGQVFPAKYHSMQKGCPDLVPGLSLRGFWDTKQFDWIQKLEEQAPIIREELLRLRDSVGFQPYRSPAYANEKNLAPDQIGSLGTDNGNWNVFYLYLHDIKFDENCSKVPETIKILKNLVPRSYMHCFFSALTSGSHITAHNGPTGKKLRVHLPLVGVQGARMRVGEDTVNLEQDKCIMFDDSFNHEAWYDGSQTRINLILDLWHPELTDPEVKFFEMLLKSKLKGDKFLSDKIDNQDHLYSIIEKTKGLIKTNDDWWIN